MAAHVAPIYKKEAESRGIEVVYDEKFQAGTVDMTPYLTKIKYADPDALILMPSRASYPGAIFKQIGELCGWGDIRVFSPNSQTTSVSNHPTAEGLISWVKKYGKEPFNMKEWSFPMADADQMEDICAWDH